MEFPIENFDLKRRKELLTKYEKGIVMSCIDCNITKKHALETMRIKYPRIFSIVINDWDYYYKEYNTVKINEDEDEGLCNICNKWEPINKFDWKEGIPCPCQPCKSCYVSEKEIALLNNVEVEIYDWIDAKSEVKKASKVPKRPPAQKKGSRGLMVSNKEEVKSWDILYGRTHEHNGLPKGDKKKK